MFPSRVRDLFVLVAMLLLLAPAGVAKQRARKHEPRRKNVKPIPSPKIEDEDEFREDQAGRQQWFVEQRAYPFGSVPVDGRRRAWRARPANAARAALQTWTQIGPTGTNSGFPNNWGLTSGRINAIAVSPANSQVVLVGAATGGIWRSTDGGTSFTAATDDQVDLAVGSIAFAPSDSNVVYAGMGDSQGGYLGTGVLKSTDAGQTWTRVSNSSLPAPGEIAKIAVDPTNANRVYVAQYARLNSGSLFSSGFYYSTDGGVSWTQSLVGLARDLVVDPFNAQTLYLAMSRVDQSGLPAGLYRSTNGGQTWTGIYTSPYTTTYDVVAAVTPAAAGTIYVYLGGNGGFRVEVSTNGGQTWTNRGASGLDTAQFGYNTYIYVDPTNANTVYAGTRDVYKSTNAGVSWTNLTNNFSLNGSYHPNVAKSHPDQHAFAFQPGSGSTFYIGNDGGLSKTTNGGSSFASLNASLALTMFVGYAQHPTDATISYGGTQDNGTQRRQAQSGPAAWQEFISGDGGNCVVDAVTPSIVFTTYVYNNVYRFSSNGDVFDDQVLADSTVSGDRSGFYAPFVGNGVNSTLYFGTYRLWVSTNRGSTWSAPGGAQDLTNGGVLTAIAVAKSATNTIYTGSSDGRASASTNGGATWTNISAGLPNRYITDIAVDPANPAVAYLTVSGYNSGHVFKTTNTGATWTDISGSLPNIPTNAVLIDPLNSNTLYVATDVGVFLSTSQGSWATFNTGMPPAIVETLTAQQSGLVQAGTYGRGAYELQPNQTGGTDTIGIYTAVAGAWFLRNSNSGGPADLVFTYGPAAVAWVPLSGDWNGDGTDTPGLYDPSTGAFFLKNTNAPGGADLVFTFGAANPAFRPIVGDWNGDGTDTIGLYDSSTGAFFLRNTNTPGAADAVFTFGAASIYTPIVGDWNGDGTDTIGLYNPSNGVFFLKNTNAGGGADAAFQFGAGAAVPLSGDWNNDGTDTPGLYLSASGAFFLKNTNAPGGADLVFTYGAPNATPLAGNWDGQ